MANQIKSMNKLKEVLRYQIKGNYDPAFHLSFIIYNLSLLQQHLNKLRFRQDFDSQLGGFFEFGGAHVFTGYEVVYFR